MSSSSERAGRAGKAGGGVGCASVGKAAKTRPTTPHHAPLLALPASPAPPALFGTDMRQSPYNQLWSPKTMKKRTRQFVFVAAGILVFGLGTGLFASYMG